MQYGKRNVKFCIKIRNVGIQCLSPLFVLYDQRTRVNPISLTYFVKNNCSRLLKQSTIIVTLNLFFRSFKQNEMNIRGKYSLPHQRFSCHCTTVTPVQYILLQSPSLPFHTIPFYIFVSFMAGNGCSKQSCFIFTTVLSKQPKQIVSHKLLKKLQKYGRRFKCTK